MTTNYRRGYERERKTVSILEKAGYYCVRAGGSKGLFDVVAIGPKDIKLIQVKNNRAPNPVEMEAIEEFDSPPFATKEVWVYRDGSSNPTTIKRVA